MAELTVQDVARDGLQPSYDAAASGGDSFANNGNTLFHVKNDDASSHTATIASEANAPVGTAQADISVAVPAGEERMIGPLPKGAFNDGNGLANVTYDAVTSVTVAAISMGDAIEK